MTGADDTISTGRACPAWSVWADPAGIDVAFEQKLLLKDPNHVRTVQRWTKVNGERQATTKQQAVRPWWKTDPSGQVVMSIKFGAKPIEFEKGKAGIVAGSKDKLPAVIDTLIAAVRAGELDELFSQAAKTGSIGKARKAA
jgi:hypothetical protein